MSKKIRVVNGNHHQVGKRKQSEASNEPPEEGHGFRGYYMSIVVETSFTRKTATGDKVAFRPVSPFRSCVQFWPKKVEGSAKSSSEGLGLEVDSDDEDFDDDDAEELAEEFAEEFNGQELMEGELELLVQDADTPPDLGSSVRTLL